MDGIRRVIKIIITKLIVTVSQLEFELIATFLIPHFVSSLLVTIQAFAICNKQKQIRDIIIFLVPAI